MTPNSRSIQLPASHSSLPLLSLSPFFIFSFSATVAPRSTFISAGSAAPRRGLHPPPPPHLRLPLVAPAARGAGSAAAGVRSADAGGQWRVLLRPAVAGRGSRRPRDGHPARRRRGPLPLQPALRALASHGVRCVSGVGTRICRVGIADRCACGRGWCHGCGTVCAGCS